MTTAHEQFNCGVRAVDFDKALTTFAGSDPANPDATRRTTVSELPSTGADISVWFTGH